ncbi:hypothetical protein [Arthrobacter sp. yr096]|uniref:hypothetical protein n=1 Tax=Arthrobacter sp. yr096 TaxID=1761750 RepID=UPI000B877D99|nr:hypothetical protein [Arthrobacter sp. yr096]
MPNHRTSTLLSADGQLKPEELIAVAAVIAALKRRKMAPTLASKVTPHRWNTDGYPARSVHDHEWGTPAAYIAQLHQARSMLPYIMPLSLRKTAQ